MLTIRRFFNLPFFREKEGKSKEKPIAASGGSLLNMCHGWLVSRVFVFDLD